MDFFLIKQTQYTVRSLLKDEKLAKRYEGGTAYIIRLTVDDYHRYCYVADGVKSAQRKIRGVFHTVNPVANDYAPIYKMNTKGILSCTDRRTGNRFADGSRCSYGWTD